MLLGHGKGFTYATHQVGAITQEEKQQVQHDAKADDEIQGTLAKAEGLAGKVLTTDHRAFGELVLKPGKVAHAQALEEVLHEHRQRFFEVSHVGRDVQLAAFDVLVERRTLLHQQSADDDYWQDRDDHGDGQGDQRDDVARPFEALNQTALQGRKDDPEDDSPEHRAVVRQQDPDKGEADQNQQDQQGSIVQVGVVHVRSVSKASGA